MLSTTLATVSSWQHKQGSWKKSKKRKRKTFYSQFWSRCVRTFEKQKNKMKQMDILGWI